MVGRRSARGSLLLDAGWPNALDAVGGMWAMNRIFERTRASGDEASEFYFIWDPLRSPWGESRCSIGVIGIRDGASPTVTRSLFDVIPGFGSSCLPGGVVRDRMCARGINVRPRGHSER